MSRLDHWKSQFHRARFRCLNLCLDLYEVIVLDRCCAVPTRAGYPFWRCGLHGGHTGPHRHRNYIWRIGRTVQYAPDYRTVEEYRDPRQRQPGVAAPGFLKRPR